MAASAYAFLVSLMNTMDQIQIHPLLSTCFDSNQFESLGKKVDFLLDFVENHSDAVIGEKVDFLLEAETTQEENLLSRIAAVAQLAEDIIEVEAADRIRDESTKITPTFFHDLQKKMEEMDCIIKDEVIKVKEGSQSTLSTAPPPPPSSSPSSSPATARTETMVGFDGYLEQLLDELTGYHSGRRVLPIVGMGGAGKTTLARNAYDNLLTVEHFDIRVWITVSQAFTLKDILLQALSFLGGSSTKTDRSDNELGEELRKILYCRRYLIVLDDVWSVEAWEKLKLYFPENCNRSRIVVTTRQQAVVDYFASSTVVVDFLDDEHSWELFCDKTFGQNDCPAELEEIGKKIVKKSKGLPLALSVIGGLLGKSPRTQEYWGKIANDKSLILKHSYEGNNALSILYLSYKHMPVWLKSCFLLLGLFPEDHEIDVSKLIKYWIAQGFIKQNGKQSMEEVGESYIKDLADRNLLIGFSGNINYGICRIHDVVRELCIRIAEKENFYCVQRSIDGRRQFIVDQRTASFYPPQSLTSTRPSPYHPIIFEGQKQAPFKCRLLRVLDGDIGCLNGSSHEVNLRLLFGVVNLSSNDLISALEAALELLKALNSRSYDFPTYEFPPSISLCWCLHTLTFHMSYLAVLPPEIWKMPQLRHIEMSSIHLSDPPCDAFVLQNLQTLTCVKNLNLSEEVCKRIPNIKKLHLAYDFNKEEGGASRCFNLQNLTLLNKLEYLQYYFQGKEYVDGPLRNLQLPSSLKELGLWDCNLVWNDMKMIASLPHLEGLELHGRAVVETEWNFAEEKFRCLRFLDIHGCHELINMSADSSNFPVLRELSIGSLSKLEEIPSGIGDIPTLVIMRLSNCSESATISAIKILEEQESLGNEDLHLILGISDKSQNLHISDRY